MYPFQSGNFKTQEQKLRLYLCKQFLLDHWPTLLIRIFNTGYIIALILHSVVYSLLGLSPDPSAAATREDDDVDGRSTTLLSLLSLLESPTFCSMLRDSAGGGGAVATGTGGTKFGVPMQMRLDGGGATWPSRALDRVVPEETGSNVISSPK